MTCGALQFSFDLPVADALLGWQLKSKNPFGGTQFNEQSISHKRR
jgi:hypothetical protein